MVEGASQARLVMKARRTTIAKARTLRRALSPPEARLWNRLKQRHPDQPVFRRQHPLGPYVLDFYCAAAKLAIEIDGWGHLAADRPERDRRRDEWLLSQGVVLGDFEATLEGIVETARELSRKG